MIKKGEEREIREGHGAEVRRREGGKGRDWVEGPHTELGAGRQRLGNRMGCTEGQVSMCGWGKEGAKG